MCANWTYSLFYAIADISGNILLTFAFWQLVNQITTSKADAGRLYPIYGMYGNIAGIVSAGMLGRVLDYFFVGATRATVIRARIFAVAIALSITIALYLVLYHYFLDPSEREAPVQQKSKPKVSFSESARLLLGSPYLFCIAMMTLCYGVSVNLVEVTWKECIKAGSSNPKEFMEFFDNLYVAMGIVTFLTGIVGTGVARRLGWLGQAIATPVMLAITGLLFYLFAIFSSPHLLGTDSTRAIIAAMLGDPIFLAMYLGAAQNVLSKASKYSMFDPAQQMTYAVLPIDVRTVGKAAVDVIGGRFGKSGGALIQCVLAMICGYEHQMQYVPFLVVLFAIVCTCWILAVLRLNREYTKLTHELDTNQQKQSPRS